MKSKASRIDALAEALKVFLENEERVCRETISLLLESVSAIQSTTSDVRIQRLGTRLDELRHRISLLAEMSQRDFLDEIKTRASELIAESGSVGLERIIAEIMD